MKNKIIALVLLVFMLSGVLNVSAYDIRQWYDSEYDLSLNNIELKWEKDSLNATSIKVVKNFDDGQIYIECKPGYQVTFYEYEQNKTIDASQQKWVDFTYVNTYADKEYAIVVKSVEGAEISKDTPNKYVNVSKVDLRYHIPEYYKQHIIEKAQVINNYQDNKDAFSFIVLADMHLQNNAKHSPAMIKYLENQCGIRTIINLEDVDLYQQDKTEVSYLFENKMPVVATNDKKYFYTDDTINKMRYIVVDFKESSSVDYMAESFTDSIYAVTDEQELWLKNDALNLPDESWNYAIFTHAPVYDELNSPWGTAPVWKNDISEILADADGNFLGVISGQTGLDGMLRFNGFNIVITASDSAIGRETNTEVEQSFDVYTVDPVNKIVYITKIGAGKDRSFIY